MKMEVGAIWLMIQCWNSPCPPYKLFERVENEIHLLQEHGVIPLEGLENVVVAAQSTQAVDGCVSVATTALPAYIQRHCCVRGGVRLQTWGESAHIVRCDTGGGASCCGNVWAMRLAVLTGFKVFSSLSYS